MKKFLMVAMTLCLVFSMVQVTVADDRLKLSGSLRLRAFNFDNRDLDADLDDNAKYFDSRMRFGLAITIAEGITANYRVDFNDDALWGEQGANFGRPSSSNQRFNPDQMYVRIEKDLFILQAGNIFQAFGAPRLATSYAVLDTGFGLRLKTPVVVDFNYFKIDEGSDRIDEEDLQKDTDVYGLQASYKADMFSAGAFYAAINDSKDSADSPNVIGLWGNTKVGPVAINAALDMFGGSSDAADVDYMGTQFWLNGEMAATEAVKVGANLYYAMGTSDDGEKQLSTLPTPKYGGFEPHEKGVQTLADGMDPSGKNDPFMPVQNAGSQGFDVYAFFNPMDKVTIVGQIGYFMPQEDDATEWESSTLLQASISYAFAPKCELLGSIYHRTDDVEDVDTDAELGMAALMQVAW